MVMSCLLEPITLILELHWFVDYFAEINGKKVQSVKLSHGSVSDFDWHY